MKTNALLATAMEKWLDLTGYNPEQTTFRMGDIDLRRTHETLKEAQDLDPDGTTPYMLLECFLRHYLEDKTFTAAQIMKDYDALTTYLAKAQDLFALLQSDHAVELGADFRTRVTQGVKAYDADREDVLEMINNFDILPFLRRDALCSLNSLTPYQFLSGTFDTTHPQVIEHVYQAWDINALLTSLRDMPVSGIAVVLLRDPAHPDRSYFAFAMRNGENVTLFTDKTRPAYPGQEDAMRSRGRSRTYAARSWANHFPYQIIPTSIDDRGDVVFEKETTPVMAGQNLVPLMRIKDLPASQIIWLTMMLSLIADKFWKKQWQAQALSYTGKMVERKTLLVETGDTMLPVAKKYQPITLEDVTLEDIGRETIKEQLQNAGQFNAWMEERYAHSVDTSVLNQWVSSDDDLRLLPAVKKTDGPSRPVKGTAVSPFVETFSKREIERAASWNRPSGYDLKAFTPGMFGTQEELEQDRAWIARYNLAQHIQREADKEYEARKAEVTSWFTKQITANLDTLVQRAARYLNDAEGQDRYYLPTLMVDDIKSDLWTYKTFISENLLGTYQYPGNKFLCPINETVSSWRALFSPQTAQDLADLAGCTIEEMPDILHHWSKESPYVGNHILNRLDPVETHVNDPWVKHSFRVNLVLSKRAMTAARKTA